MKRIAASILIVACTAGLSRGEMITYTVGPIADVSWNGGVQGVRGDLALVGFNGRTSPGLDYTASFLTGDLSSTNPLEFATGGRLVIRDKQGTGLFLGVFSDGGSIVDQGGGLYRFQGAGLMGQFAKVGFVFDGELTLNFSDSNLSDGFSVTSIDSGTIRLDFGSSNPSVPEPSSFILAGVGLAAAGIVAYRRKK